MRRAKIMTLTTPFDARSFPHPWGVPQGWGTQLVRRLAPCGSDLAFQAIACAYGLWMKSDEEMTLTEIIGSPRSKKKDLGHPPMLLT